LRADKNGIIHGGIGRVAFEASALKENLEALIADLKKIKPASAKGIYLKKVTLSTTMGPGLSSDHSSLELYSGQGNLTDFGVCTVASAGRQRSQVPGCIKV